MTYPQPSPIPIAVPTPMFCRRCEIHWATTAQPLCPVCLDDKTKEARQ